MKYTVATMQMPLNSGSCISVPPVLQLEFIELEATKICTQTICCHSNTTYSIEKRQVTLNYNSRLLFAIDAHEEKTPMCRTESRHWSVCCTPFFHFAPARRRLSEANKTTTTASTTNSTFERVTIAFELSAFNVYTVQYA